MHRLPIIRHIRWAYFTWQVERHYAAWRRLGFLEATNSDRVMLDAIWRGDA